MDLKDFNIAVAPRPDNIDEILQGGPAAIAAIDDIDVANGVQATLAAYMLWLRQEMGATKTKINSLDAEFSLKLSQESLKVVPKSTPLTEKRNLAIYASEELTSMNLELINLKNKYAMLESSIEDIPHLIEVVKQQYYRLRLQTYEK